MRIDFNSLGDRMKSYEASESSRRFLPTIPVIARMDGRAFHQFTKGLNRPYDERLIKCFQETTKDLIHETDADLGYCQSDEITLVWKNGLNDYFSGRIMKISSNLSAFATIRFYKHLLYYLPEKSNKSPIFDARVFQVPNIEEAVNCILWREMEATKNSISMAAQSVFSHKELHKKNSKDKLKMLQDVGVSWEKFPDSFKKGSYFSRKKIMKPFSTEELENLPMKHHARKNPDLIIKRTVIEELKIKPLTKVDDKVKELFGE